MKRQFIIILFFILILISSCQDPIFEVSDNTSNTSDTSMELPNAPILKAAGEFEFTASNDKASVIQHDGVKISYLFNQDSGLLYYDNTSYGLLVYDEETGKITHACKDALCEHKTHECPYFRHTGRINVREGYAYFSQHYNVFNSDGQVTQKVNRYVRVNINTNEVEVLKELDDEVSYSRLVSDLYTDTHYYYFDLADPENEGDNIEITLMRTNLLTDEVEAVKKLGTQSYFLITYLDGKIYWYDPILEKFMYSENEDLSDPVEFFSIYGAMSPVYSNGSIIYFIYDKLDIYSYDLESGENRLLAEPNNTRYFITDNYIYYSDELQSIKLDPEPLRGEVISIADNAIWRVNRKTGEKEKVFRLSDVAPKNVISDFYVSGNYIYAIYIFPNSDYNGTVSSEDFSVRQLLRINITTKELYIIELPEPLYNG
ncbi:MAG: hypothetical protein PHY15_00300 [Eubacteriales bacterium]|nr:hypothetical protein [Eubacteriales bacterium]MDD4475549.1 hypothetical protein [Eubacteriales bacterium]